MACSDSGATPSAAAAAPVRAMICSRWAGLSGPASITAGPMNGSAAGLGPVDAGFAEPGVVVVGSGVWFIVSRVLAVPMVVAAALERNETVADVAHGADQRLVFGAELGPQPPDVHVHRAGAAEVVITPDLLQEVGPGKDPARVLGQELQQLELLEREVERAPAQPGGVGGLVDGQVTGPDLVRRVGGGTTGPAAPRQPQPGLDLGRACCVEDHIVGPPVGADRGQATLGDDDHERAVQPGGEQQLADALTVSKITAGIDQ